MRIDELQYISDTVLIEKLASDPNLLKQAGLFEDIGFSSVAETVKQFAKEHVRADAPGGYIGSILSLLAPAVMFKIHPILGIAAAAAYALGFDIVSAAKKILGGLSGKIDSGESIDLSEVSSLGKEVVSQQTGDMSEADDMLFPARQTLEASAASRSMLGGLPKTPLGYTKGAPLLQRIFGNLSKARGIWLVGGILVWLLQTILLGAGLIAGAEFVRRVVTKPESETPAEQPQPQEQTTKEPNRTTLPPPPPKQDPFKASGRGEQYFVNDSNNIWIVPLINRSIDDTLIAWAVDVYPELADHVYEIESSSVFDNIVSELAKNFSAKSSGSLIMPIGLHTRKQVVDLFASDVKTLLRDVK